jgi:hypothetical protein
VWCDGGDLAVPAWCCAGELLTGHAFAFAATKSASRSLRTYVLNIIYHIALASGYWRALQATGHAHARTHTHRAHQHYRCSVLMLAVLVLGAGLVLLVPVLLWSAWCCWFWCLDLSPLCHLKPNKRGGRKEKKRTTHDKPTCIAFAPAPVAASSLLGDRGGGGQGGRGASALLTYLNKKEKEKSEARQARALTCGWCRTVHREGLADTLPLPRRFPALLHRVASSTRAQRLAR